MTMVAFFYYYFGMCAKHCTQRMQPATKLKKSPMRARTLWGVGRINDARHLFWSTRDPRHERTSQESDGHSRSQHPCGLAEAQLACLQEGDGTWGMRSRCGLDLRPHDKTARASLVPAAVVIATRPKQNRRRFFSARIFLELARA